MVIMRPIRFDRNHDNANSDEMMHPIQRGKMTPESCIPIIPILALDMFLFRSGGETGNDYYISHYLLYSGPYVVINGQPSTAGD